MGRPMFSLGKILVVDDDPDVATLIEITLSKVGYTVSAANNVPEALETLSKDSFDLIITDINMPGASGLDLIEAMRDADVDADVLILSAQGTIGIAVEAMRAGARNYLEKPVDPQRLKQEVRDTFRARQARKHGYEATQSSPGVATPRRASSARTTPPIASAYDATIHRPFVEPVPQLDPAVPPRRASFWPGDRDRSVPTDIGRYKVLGQLGAGGMGTVYRARDTVLQRIVAVKVMAVGRDHPDLYQRFCREAQAAASLNHPHIATVFDFGLVQDQNMLFIAMEHVDGPSLDEVLTKEAPLEPARVLPLIYQLVDALEHAHTQGVIHRDIKPGNILLAGGDRVKLVDFGIAHLRGSELTRAGMMMGSPGYMSPEAASASSIDYRADQFSVGTVMFEALTSVRPFSADHPAGTLRNIIEREPEPLSNFDVDIPGLQEIMSRLHAKKPEQRYERELELLDALAEVGRSLGLTLHPALPRKPARSVT